MREVLKAALTVWYLVLTSIFLMATMVSVMVILGAAGDSGPYTPWIGVLCTVVFWKAMATYRMKFTERVEAVQKNSERRNDDDDLS